MCIFKRFLKTIPVWRVCIQAPKHSSEQIKETSTCLLDENLQSCIPTWPGLVEWHTDGIGRSLVPSQYTDRVWDWPNCAVLETFVAELHLQLKKKQPCSGRSSLQCIKFGGGAVFGFDAQTLKKASVVRGWNKYGQSGNFLLCRGRNTIVLSWQDMFRKQ